jgi:CubicO group peptidase (beta-lactamase class C family)
MVKLSRRQFLKHSGTALLGLSGFSLANLYYQRSNANESLDNNFAILEERIPLWMSQAKIPGISVAVIKSGQLVWSRGFGVKNRKLQDPVEDNTIFAAASLSKPLFAYTVLKLCEEGQLNLDTPLTEYTAKPYIKDSRIKQITARMVLSHTTGFPNWSGSAPLSIQNKPGTRFGYSGEGFLYLQRVVEEITRQPLGDYILSNTLVPLVMNRSSYVWEQGYQFLATDGHDRQGNPKPMSHPKKALSAGSLRTTATEYAQFLLGMMNSGSIESPELTETTLEEMLRPQAKISQSLSWGLGWGLEKTADGDFFWHWGDSITFKSFTVASRTLKTGIVILTNSQNGLRICQEIVALAIGGEHPAFRFRMIDY